MRILLCIASAIIANTLVQSEALLAQSPADGGASAIYQSSSPSVFLIEVRGEGGDVLGIGSAFLVERDLLVTNAHVVRGGRPYLKTGAVALPLTVERLDADQDLAVLRAVTPLEAAPLQLASGEPPVGTPVFVLGNPQGLERSISEGIISGVRSRGARRLMQLTAPVSPGSSGGPVLTSDGAVVGVTVGYLEGGQNLNFAIPSASVRALLMAPTSGGGFAGAAMSVRELLGRPRPDPRDDASWKRRRENLRDALEGAAVRANSGPEFLQLGVLADSAYHSDLAVQYAGEAIRRDKSLADSARSVMVNAWRLTVFLTDSSDKPALRQMLSVADSLIAHRPSDTEALVFRAEVLDRLGRGAESIIAARRAVELGKGAKRIGWYWTEYHTVSAKYAQPADDDAVFSAMVRAGEADSYDWASHAKHLRDRERWSAAGDAYAQAYRLTSEESPSGEYACEAGRMYHYADLPDQSLDALRTCIKVYSIAESVDTASVAYAHRALATILNDRNVFAQAESHARQALALAPDDAWAALALSRALEGEQRPSEAAIAAEEAIRLSDGRYSSMHFQAGSAYFELEDWTRCSRAYQKAAELNVKDDAAPYNTALCLARQGYYRDAARWMEQALARNPNRADKADIQRRIAAWRR